MNIQENQDINSGFGSHLKQFPKRRMVDIAKRRVAPRGDDEEEANYNQRVEDFRKTMKLDSLKNPDADDSVISLWEQAKADLSLLRTDIEHPLASMSSSLWNLAFKEFAEYFMGGESKEEKKDYLKMMLGLPDNNIDAERELKNILKEKICERTYTINGNEMDMFNKEDAQKFTPQELCEKLDKRIAKMSKILDDDATDRANFLSAQKTYTDDEFLSALANYLDDRIGKVMNKGGVKKYNVLYDENRNALICQHAKTMDEVIVVTPSYENSDNNGSSENGSYDITVGPLSVPDNPTVADSKDMTEVMDYVSRHRQYAPEDNGEYTIPGVKGMDLPSYIYNAIQDWQATATACLSVANAWTDAKELVGDDNMQTLKNRVRDVEYERNLGNTKGYSTKYPESHMKTFNKMKDRAEYVSPKVDENGNFMDEDVSNALKNVQIALGGSTPDGEVLTPEELNSIFGMDIDDGMEDDDI
jgi:hypothetical protein